MATDIDITNRALAQIGTRSQITSFADGSAEGLYAGLLFVPLRDFMLREGDYDFATQNVAAVPAAAPQLPWTSSYQYPSGCIRLRQAIPTVYNLLDPEAVTWGVMNNGTSLVIMTTVAVSRFIITAAPPSIDNWDSMFTEAYTRLLASALAFALENRIEASNIKLDQALTFAGIANLRDP